RCGKGWKGNRCHISAKPLQPPTSSILQNDIWIGLGIGFLLIKITAAALYFLSKKKVPEMKVQETISSFANPLYKDLSSSGKVKSPRYAISSAVQISVSPWHEYPFNENMNATSFPNPLYGVAAEDMEKLCSSLK
ncbi:MALR1 protein, partial [Urocynchramus pylzowi]|nr:MALR1 protein [Urocynchramus pylzowi]